jgi:hypothetical protein
MNISIFDKSAVQSALAPRFVAPASFALISIALLRSAVALRSATLLRSVLALRPATLLRASAH